MLQRTMFVMVAVLNVALIALDYRAQQKRLRRWAAIGGEPVPAPRLQRA